MADTPGIKTIGLPFIELQSVDSTNNYARAQIHAELAHHGMAIFAHEQTKGKGQPGRKWATEKDAGMALSIIVQPDFLSPVQQFQLSACAAMSAHQVIAVLAGDETTIKWPNDIYWRNRKAGGILIESIISHNRPGHPAWQWAIVGIGFNINQEKFPDWLPNPVSLKQITGKHFDIMSMAKDYCRHFDANYTLLRNGGFDQVYQYYISHLFKKGELVKLKENSRVFEATIKTVTEQGKLIVQHSMEEEFISGQLEWVLR